MRSCVESVLRFVAIGAIDTRFLGAMAIHAAAHRYVRLAKKLVARGDGPVALRACVARVQMRFVAEVHKARDLVNPRPRNFAAILRKGGHLLNRGAIRFYGGMALHTHACRGDGHDLARIWIRMAHLALQL